MIANRVTFLVPGNHCQIIEHWPMTEHVSMLIVQVSLQRVVVPLLRLATCDAIIKSPSVDFTNRLLSCIKSTIRLGAVANCITCIANARTVADPDYKVLRHVVHALANHQMNASSINGVVVRIGMIILWTQRTLVDVGGFQHLLNSCTDS